MTRFFFHIRDGESLIKDAIGIDLPDVDAARYDAEQSARELLAENLRFRDPLDPRCYEVTDESGIVLFNFPFKSIIK